MLGIDVSKPEIMHVNNKGTNQHVHLLSLVSTFDILFLQSLIFGQYSREVIFVSHLIAKPPFLQPGPSAGNNKNLTNDIELSISQHWTKRRERRIWWHKTW